MKTDEIKALEKIYAAEVENRLPFQSKAAIYKRLAEFDLVEPMTAKFGLATVHGWQLTHSGRLLYCNNCGNDK